MERITVWTKQHQDVARELAATGRHIARRAYIQQDLQEHAPLVLEVYDWLVRHCPTAARKPADVEYPVWVSFQQDATMLPSPGTVLLELSVDPSQVALVNIHKWGAILNYSYIPADQQDEERHRQLLDQYGVSDPQAYMSPFYPRIKREIIASWDRLFDPAVSMGNPNCYGILWEIRQEWVRKMVQ